MVACADSPYTFANDATTANVENIRWSHDGTGSITSGQGTFTPTYTPGIGESGVVVFTLTGDLLTPCTGEQTDTVELSLVSNPEANAGSSFTTCSGSFTLGGSVLHSNAFAWSG